MGLGNVLLQHTHLLGIVGGILVTGIYALRGFYRKNAVRISESDEMELVEGEYAWGYRGGHWKRTVALGAILVALTASFVYVPRGYAGVIYDASQGILEAELSPGLRIVAPLKQWVTNVNTQVQVFRHNDEKAWMHTEDTQEIRVPFAVNYRIIDPSYVFQNISDGVGTVLVPASLRAMRTEIGSFPLEEVAPKQNEIVTGIEDEISQPMAAQGIEIVYVAIEDTIARPGIIEAIEAEKIAARNVLTAGHNKAIAKLNADAVIETAIGEAGAIERVAIAKDMEQELLNMNALQYIWFKVWDGMVPQIVTEGSEFIFDGLGARPAPSEDGS